jgi:hypothetical protein
MINPNSFPLGDRYIGLQGLFVGLISISIELISQSLGYGNDSHAIAFVVATSGLLAIFQKDMLKSVAWCLSLTAVTILNVALVGFVNTSRFNIIPAAIVFSIEFSLLILLKRFVIAPHFEAMRKEKDG